MYTFNENTIAWMQSQPTSVLTRLLSSMPQDRQIAMLTALRQSVVNPQTTERDKDAQRKRDKRSESARIEIPECVDPARREAALADPVKFLLTYFPERYTIAFGRHHLRMIDDIVNRAKHGGNQAIAAPRGCGKSEVVKGVIAYLVFAELVRFPLLVAATTSLAKRLFSDFRTKLSGNKLLLADFPEVCYPIKALDGAPQRASRQHVDGAATNIVWTATDYIRLADVVGSPYGGVKMSYFGLDAAFRGVNIDGDRPDFVLIDDPETEESANSIPQIEGREDTIDKGITGLAGQDGSLAIVVLTTVQNGICLSYRLTDRKIKPSMSGVRYGMVVKWPDRMDLWNDYTSTRQANQTAGDEHAREAVAFYLENREEMNAGVEMLSEHFVEIEVDGDQMVHSAIQQAFNKIADTSIAAYKSEYQNDPELDEQPETVGLTAGKVASRLSGHLQDVIPSDTEFVTVGLDIGKYYSHWVKTAWQGNAIGHIVNYGVMETPGMMTATDSRSVMQALVPALLQWRTDMIADSSIDFCLVDSGDYTDAVYEFVRQVGGTPFAAAKGWDTGRFRVGKEAPDRRPFTEAYAHHLPAERLWLYNVNTEYWKQWLHERFATATLDEDGRPNDGAMSLFSAPGDRKRHLSISHHIVAEERREVFVPGKGLVRKWTVLSRNNHYLDAAALSCAAAGCLGVRVVPRTVVTASPATAKKQERKPIVNQHGQPFLATER